MKKIVKSVVLSLLSLVAMALCGTAVIKIYDMLLGSSFENIWVAGFQAGLIARILEIVWNTVQKMKNKKSQ